MLLLFCLTVITIIISSMIIIIAIIIITTYSYRYIFIVILIIVLISYVSEINYLSIYLSYSCNYHIKLHQIVLIAVFAICLLKDHLVNVIFVNFLIICFHSYMYIKIVDHSCYVMILMHGVVVMLTT